MGVSGVWMLSGANGYTLVDEASSPLPAQFDAVVLDGGQIVAAGQAADLRLAFAGHLTRDLDVDGATIIPGLVDSHLHVAALGEQSMVLDLTSVASAGELLQRLRDASQKLDPGTWLIGRGWDEHRLAGGQLPSIEALDDAAGPHPMLLTRVCHHAYLANHAAFACAGITDGVSDPEDGNYGRDDAGRLNGWVYENASTPLKRAIPSRTEQAWEQALEAGMRTALAAGITAVHTDDARNLGGFAPVWRLYDRLIRTRSIRLRVHELVDWSYLDEARRTLEDSGIAQDDWLEVGAAKLFADGALGGRTAWLREAYADAPGWHGTPMYTVEEIAERVRVARDRGFPAAIHAIGDAGLDAALHALAGAATRNGNVASPERGFVSRTARNRIVHAEVIRPDQIDRMRALGESLAIDIQPRFVCSDFPWVLDRVGPERARFVCAWRTLQAAGLHIAGGSDAPIEPVAPLLGVHAAVTRRDTYADGPGYGLEESLSIEEALRLFTRSACFANESQDRKGLIAPGWAADLTVIDRDVVRPAHPDVLRDARVCMTIVGGDVAYVNAGWSGATQGHSMGDAS